MSNLKLFLRVKALIVFVCAISIGFGCSPKKKESEFVKLFDGKNLDGWDLKLRNGDPEMAKKIYAIEDGVIHVYNEDFPDSLDLFQETNGTHGLFFTKEIYSQYILRFEYKWGTKIANNFDMFQYDAGMYYHVYDNSIWPKGIEYQIRYDHLADKNHTGDFWASGTRFQWYAGEDGTYLSPEEGGVAQEKKRGQHLAASNAKHHALDGEWNQCELIVMGDKYAIHKLNGQIVNAATELSRADGVIGFQSETAEIFYRNIEIKVLDEVVPMGEFMK